MGTPVTTLGHGAQGKTERPCACYGQAVLQDLRRVSSNPRRAAVLCGEQPRRRVGRRRKYHLGIRASSLETRSRRGGLYHLAPNPSHLEHVNPVVQGMARAFQEEGSEARPPRRTCRRHGPSCCTGRGVPRRGGLSRDLDLSRLPVMHWLAPSTLPTNQLRVHTERQDAPLDDLRKRPGQGYEIPVVHVNADDPERACPW